MPFFKVVWASQAPAVPSPKHTFFARKHWYSLIFLNIKKATEMYQNIYNGESSNLLVFLVYIPI